MSYRPCLFDWFSHNLRQLLLHYPLCAQLLLHLLHLCTPVSLTACLRDRCSDPRGPAGDGRAYRNPSRGSSVALSGFKPCSFTPEWRVLSTGGHGGMPLRPPGRERRPGRIYHGAHSGATLFLGCSQMVIEGHGPRKVMGVTGQASFAQRVAISPRISDAIVPSPPLLPQVQSEASLTPADDLLCV